MSSLFNHLLVSSVFFGKDFFFGGSVLGFLGFRSATLIGATVLLVGSNVKRSGSVDVDAYGGDGVGLGVGLRDCRDSATTRILFAVME